MRLPAWTGPVTRPVGHPQAMPLPSPLEGGGERQRRSTTGVMRSMTDEGETRCWGFRPSPTGSHPAHPGEGRDPDAKSRSRGQRHDCLRNPPQTRSYDLDPGLRRDERKIGDELRPYPRIFPLQCIAPQRLRKNFHPFFRPHWRGPYPQAIPSHGKGARPATLRRRAVIERDIAAGRITRRVRDMERCPCPPVQGLNTG